MSIHHEPHTASPLNRVIAYLIVVFIFFAMVGFAVLVLLIADTTQGDQAIARTVLVAARVT